MKVAFVIPRLDPSHGGVERYAFALGCGLARRGLRVRAFTTSPASRLPSRPPGFEIETLALAPGPRTSRDRRFEAAARHRLGGLDGWDVVQGFGATRIHTHHRIGGGSHAAYLRARARFEPSWRRWLGRHHPRHRARIARQQSIWREPRVRLAANSELGRRHACRDAGLAPGRVSVIHNGVDLDAFRPEPDPARRLALRAELGLAPDSLAIAFVGSGFARKGLGFAIDMLAALGAAGVRSELIVAGRGRPAPYLRRARRLGVGERLHLAGPLGDVTRVYSACDVFLLPSLYEPFSNAVLEALACGLPVLVPAESGAAEVLADGREAYLLEGPDDVRGGAAALARLARHPELRFAMGASARRTAEGLGQEAHLDRVLEFYRVTAAS